MANISGVGKSAGVPVGGSHACSVKGKSFSDTLSSKVNLQSSSVQSKKSNVPVSSPTSDLARLLEGRNNPTAEKTVNAALKGTPFETLPQSAKNKIAEHLASDPRFSGRFSTV